MKTRLLIFNLIAGLLLMLPVCAQSTQGLIPCETRLKLLRDQKSKPRILMPEEMKKRVLTSIPPKLPAGCRCEGVVMVSILVDVNGKVECVKVVRGHPLLRASSVYAVKQWTFEPMKVKSQPVAFVGLVAVTFQL